MYISQDYVFADFCCPLASTLSIKKKIIVKIERF